MNGMEITPYYYYRFPVTISCSIFTFGSCRVKLFVSVSS